MWVILKSLDENVIEWIELPAGKTSCKIYMLFNTTHAFLDWEHQPQSLLSQLSHQFFQHINQSVIYNEAVMDRKHCLPEVVGKEDHDGFCDL